MNTQDRNHEIAGKRLGFIQDNGRTPPTSKFKDEAPYEIIARRNEWLLAAFTDAGYNAKLIGDPSKPVVLVDDEWVAAVRVNNFKLIFKDCFNGSDQVAEAMLNENGLEPDDVREVMSKCEHMPVWKVGKPCGNGEHLWVSGYNFVDRERKLGMYPVFAQHCPKVYFTEEKAVETVNRFHEMGLVAVKGMMTNLRVTELKK